MEAYRAISRSAGSGVASAGKHASSMHCNASAHWHLDVLQSALLRRLEPLENYVPAVVAAREQLAACGAQLGAGAACRLAVRQCAAFLLPQV